MLGKKIYKTSMLNFFRVLLLAIVIFFINDLYLETLATPKFWELLKDNTVTGRTATFFSYNYKYPADFISFFLLIIVPAIYYGFIRGVSFHEKGFSFNRGLPFMTQKVMYEDVKSYKLLHAKLSISINTKNGDAFVVNDNAVERVIAILDQHNIQGDLANEEYVKIFKFIKSAIIFVCGFVFLLFVVRKLGLLFL